MIEIVRSGFRSLFVVLLGLSVACDSQDDGADSASDNNEPPSAPRIHVVNYPLHYITTRIVGDQAQVILPESSGSDPAFWRPTDAEIQAYQASDLILLWGADFAKWVQNVSLPFDRVVDSGASIRDRYIYEEEGVSHSHGNSPAHSHGEVAFNTWLDIKLLILQARAVHDSLVDRYPRFAIEFGNGLKSLEGDLAALDQLFDEAVPTGFTETVFASHPVYQYFGQGYGVSLINFHWEPNQLPDVEEWEGFDELLETSKAKWMLWEGAPRSETKERLMQSGVTPIEFYTLSGFPSSGDFLSGMKENAERLRSAFQSP